MPVSRMAIVCCFALAAAETRFILRHIESRWQIAAFCAAAFAYEYLGSGDHQRSSGRALILSGVCMVSILAVKLSTEPEVIPVTIWTVKTELKHIKQRAKDAVRAACQRL